MKKVIVALFSLSILFVSCKKEDNNCAKTQATIAGTYKVVKLEEGFPGNLQDVTLDDIDPCELDNRLELRADGTSSYTDEGVVCTPNVSEDGNWRVNTNGTITFADGALDLEDATIVSFDCKNLVLENTETINGVILVYRVTIAKQ
jgi:hypothetical protein